MGDISTACVDEPGVFLALFGGGTHADHTVLGLKNDMYTFGKIVGDECRKADTEVDDIAVMQLLSRALGDKGFNLFFFHCYYDLTCYFFSILTMNSLVTSSRGLPFPGRYKRPRHRRMCWDRNRHHTPTPWPVHG